MKVAIRTDASPSVGSGHVMRCLSLAQALQAQQASIRFVSRSLPEHLAALVQRQGHELVSLPVLECGEDEDAARTLAAVGRCDWVVVDHYGLGERWERAVGAAGAKLLAIDDLARAHDCDVLVDQNIHPRGDERYLDRVPRRCVRLLGTRHALLDAKFEDARRAVQAREGSVERLLVFLGGMDERNVTERVLRALLDVGLHGVRVDVVIGALHPARARIEALTAELGNARCHVQTPDMAQLLAGADMAIGAGGTSTWERCALGVPALAMCVADNQRELLFHASRAGLVYAVEDGNDDVGALAIHIRALLDNPGLRNLLSRNGLDAVDARGARRVARVVSACSIEMRKAGPADSERIYQWRNHPSVRAVSRNAAKLAPDEHERWFAGALSSGTRHLLIGQHHGEDIGVVRFDVAGDAAEVSIYLAPHRIGSGLGAPLLHAAEAWLQRHRPGLKTLTAYVHAGNPQSQRLFEGCGYVPSASEYSKRI